MSDPVTYVIEQSSSRSLEVTLVGDVLREMTTITQYGGFGGTVIVMEDTLAFDPVTGLADPADLNFVGGLGPIDVSTVTDDGDRPWDTITTWTDATGALNYKVVLRDDGVNTQTFYTGDSSVSFVADTADIKDWALRQVARDASGEKTAEALLFDNGRYVETEFRAGGTPRYRDEWDGGDVFAWASKTTYWDDAGELAEMRILQDDGRLIERSYLDGVRRSEVVSDTDDRFAWERIERTYDETGALVEQVRYLDGELPPPPPPPMTDGFGTGYDFV